MGLKRKKEIKNRQNPTVYEKHRKGKSIDWKSQTKSYKSDMGHMTGKTMYKYIFNMKKVLDNFLKVKV